MHFDTMMKNRRAKGFTLIELMMAVVVIGILVAVAMPSYQDYVRRGHRTAAQAFLMDVAQRQQQYFMDNRGFTDATATLGMTTPTDVASRYTIAIVLDAGPPASFSVSAAPVGAQTQDTCGTLTLTSAGAKTSSSGSNCW